MTGQASPFVIVSSPGMHEVADRIVAILKEEHDLIYPHHRIVYERFANGEMLAHVPETVRRQHVFFLHPLQHPSPNDALMGMLLANDALKRASVAGITLVLPYMAYLRQDRKHKPRVPISARLVADLIQSNEEVEKIITVDMHADQEQGFYSIPVDNLTSMKIFAKYFAEKFGKQLADIVVVTPDFGGSVRARRFAKTLGKSSIAIYEKTRPENNVSEIVSFIGEDVSGKIAVVYDDMIDTGGTIRGVMHSLKERGAIDVYACATHGIFSGGAEVKFNAEGCKVFCTNSIPRDKAYREANASWLEKVPMESLLADSIFEASLVGGSVSKLSA